MWNNNTLEDEIQRNSLEYGVAINTDRSIPDAKSGLKPVARRIIYDAYIEKRISDKPHVKSARIVGDVMGRFHPHGDSSIYGAMIRLSQDWVLRYPLIDVHGNNGNILGDGPAASRYTEARLTKLAEEGLLTGLEKKNVDYCFNYDESEDEPITLPAIFPNLLCNPNEGLGWAMACSWAPHNLIEVAQAINDYLDGKEPMLPGPDFPTGGIIINKNDIPSIMKTGHGSVKIRGKYNIEKNNIVFYEIPYGTRLENLMEEIGAVSEKGEINGITDVRNETGKKTGLRLVIEVNKNTNINLIISQLFIKTNLQTTFSYNQVALLDKTPTEFNLKTAIEVYINHNLDCLIRETNFDLNKAEARLEIVKGLLKALEDIDNIIFLIKNSENATKAKENLITKYKFTENQAKAILDMKLARLAKLEKVEVENEIKKLKEAIEGYNTLLNNKDIQIDNIRKRLAEIVKKYGDARRTELTQIEVPKAKKEIQSVEPEKCVVIMAQDETLKRIPTTSFRTQRRNTKGIKSRGDIISATIRTNTVDSLMIFTNLGNMYRVSVNDIPVGTNSSKGTPIKNLITMLPNESTVLIYSIYRDTDAKYILFTTKNGMIKKTSLDEYVNLKKKSGIKAINLREGDMITSVNLIKDEDLILLTRHGMGIKFKSIDLSISSRVSLGIKGMSLKEDDYVVSCLPIRHDTDTLAIFSTFGYGKKINLSEFPLQGRGGKGVITHKTSSTFGEIVDGALVSDEDIILISGKDHNLCISASEIPLMSRATMGCILIKDNKVSSISKI